jgi:hypothetical protein
MESILRIIGKFLIYSILFVVVLGSPLPLLYFLDHYEEYNYFVMIFAFIGWYATILALLLYSKDSLIITEINKLLK